MESLAKLIISKLTEQLGHAPDREEIFDLYYEIIQEYKKGEVR